MSTSHLDAPSTISRQLRRNAATRSGACDYRASTAQWHADRAARRPKPATLATCRLVVRCRPLDSRRSLGVTNSFRMHPH